MFPLLFTFDWTVHAASGANETAFASMSYALLLDVTNVLISDQKFVDNNGLESLIGSQSFLLTLSPGFHTLDLANAAFGTADAEPIPAPVPEPVTFLLFALRRPGSGWLAGDSVGGSSIRDR